MGPDERIEHGMADYERLVRCEMELARTEREKAEMMKGYRETISGLKQAIARLVRKLNGEDPQIEMDVDEDDD